MQGNVLEAKTGFSKLLRLFKPKRERTIALARNGNPAAIMPTYPEAPVSKRTGIAKGQFQDPEGFDAYDEKITALLTGGDL